MQPNVATNTGAFLDNFGWNGKPLVSNETGLVKFFTKATDNTVDFIQAFFKYSNALQVVRETDSDARNSLAVNNKTGTNASATDKALNNLDAFEEASIDSNDEFLHYWKIWGIR